MLDDVVEDLGRREQQAPVERHLPLGRARRPAGALAADRQACVMRAGARGGGVEPRGDLGAGRAAVEPLERRVAGRRRARAARRRGGARARGPAGRAASASRRGRAPCRPGGRPRRRRARASGGGGRSRARAPRRPRPRPCSGARRGRVTVTLPSASTVTRTRRARGERRMRYSATAMGGRRLRLAAAPVVGGCRRRVANVNCGTEGERGRGTRLRGSAPRPSDLHVDGNSCRQRANRPAKPPREAASEHPQRRQRRVARDDRAPEVARLAQVAHGVLRHRKPSRMTGIPGG